MKRGSMGQSDGEYEKWSDQVNDGQADIGGMFKPGRNDENPTHEIGQDHGKDGEATELVDGKDTFHRHTNSLRVSIII
jgi:hypothetical protein